MILYDSPIFGPVKSRRLGVSLGINLLPKDGKWCSFDCIYCECGLNSESHATASLPTKETVVERLTEKLKEMKAECVCPDVLTFAGNGEPTLHPDFTNIVKAVREVRDEWCPSAKISILSNSTRVHIPEVREALLLFDNPIMKLDTVSASYISDIDRPVGQYDVKRTIEGLKAMKGKCIIQTMFMKSKDGSADDLSEEYVGPYLQQLKEISPRSVMIYTIDRATPVKTLEKASHEELDAIAARIRALGLECSVSY